MGMSTHVVGIRPPDDRWRQMKAIFDACVAAEVEIPDEVSEFFEGEEPDSAGVLVTLKLGHALRYINHDGQEGFEVDITKLPADVTIVRFVNSW